MEKELYDLALKDSLQFGHLESVETQLALINSMNTIPELIHALKSLPKYPEMMQQLQTLYQSEDLNGLHRMLSDPMLFPTHQHWLLLHKRKQNWITLMTQKMTALPILFAVGAGHLPGKDGLIALLRAKGFTVSPVF